MIAWRVPDINQNVYSDFETFKDSTNFLKARFAKTTLVISSLRTMSRNESISPSSPFICAKNPSTAGFWRPFGLINLKSCDSTPDEFFMTLNSVPSFSQICCWSHSDASIQLVNRYSNPSRKMWMLVTAGEGYYFSEISTDVPTLKVHISVLIHSLF